MTDYTNLDMLQSEYSDFYKEVYGFRPRHISEEHWNSEEWLENAIGKLAEEAKNEAERQNARYSSAINALEDNIVSLIKNGANDRDTAVRWLMDAEEVGNDVSYFEYRMGVPYGYIEHANQVVQEISHLSMAA